MQRDANACRFTSSKTYATRARLIAKLDELGFTDQYGYLIVRTEEGRYTAVFSHAVHGVRPAHLGFMTTN